MFADLRGEGKSPEGDGKLSAYRSTRLAPVSHELPLGKHLPLTLALSRCCSFVPIARHAVGCAPQAAQNSGRRQAMAISVMIPAGARSACTGRRNGAAIFIVHDFAPSAMQRTRMLAGRAMLPR